MAGMVHPLEEQVYFWMVTNTSQPANITASLYPPITPEGDWLDHLSSSTDVSFRLLLQDAPLGVIVLLALREGVLTSEKLFHPLMTPAMMKHLKVLKTIFTYLLKTIVGLTLMLVSLPLVLPVLFLFWLTSCLIKVVYSLKFGSDVTKAQGMDSIWGVESKESRPFITISLLLYGVPNLDKIYRHIETKILDVRDDQGDYRYKKFRQVFSQRYGYYSWRDDKDFDIQNHVRVIDLGALHSGTSLENTCPEHVTVNMLNNTTSNTESTARQGEADALVHQFLSEEGTTALSADRPPWEILLLVRHDNRYNLVVRLHHAIGDGVTMMRLCVEALVDTPISFPPVGLRPVNFFVKLAMMVWSALVLPLGLLQVVANFDHNALHGQLLSGRKVMTWSRELPLAALKQVKLAAHATVNDVLMSCLAAALAKHFARRSEEVGQVTAVVPVSFHNLQAPLVLTNRFSVATLKLPSARTLTPSARLTATKSVLEGMKRDPTLGAVFWVVRAVSQVLPAPVAELLLSGRGVTVAASNVPGPQKEITVWGDKVEDLLFWVPNRSPVGVGVSFASYMGMVRIGLNVDAALVHSREEAQTLLEDMERELHHLHQQLVLDQQ
ncbi:probable diacyglycerol O-acyltransferase tgs1 isoform X2 [Panulirus ornatus]|uniref:probable diacyglycerol O-acyltransferase tgs1 isoform X2 n=1 Tax=Panulirus ornatus TaxID=150431 RepID=UPI003A83DAB9